MEDVVQERLEKVYKIMKELNKCNKDKANINPVTTE
jgi:hypothetical protein